MNRAAKLQRAGDAAPVLRMKMTLKRRGPAAHGRAGRRKLTTLCSEYMALHPRNLLLIDKLGGHRDEVFGVGTNTLFYILVCMYECVYCSEAICHPGHQVKTIMFSPISLPRLSPAKQLEAR